MGMSALFEAPRATEGYWRSLPEIWFPFDKVSVGSQMVMSIITIHKVSYGNGPQYTMVLPLHGLRL